MISECAVSADVWFCVTSVVVEIWSSMRSTWEVRVLISSRMSATANVKVFFISSAMSRRTDLRSWLSSQSGRECVGCVSSSASRSGLALDAREALGSPRPVLPYDGLGWKSRDASLGVRCTIIPC